MFTLRDLPDDTTLSRMAKRYPDMVPLSIMTCHILMRKGSDVLIGVEKMLGKLGFSTGRFTTLMVMNRAPDEMISPSILAEKVGVTRATMTGLLDGLESDGLIARRAHEDDRRKLLVELSPKGRKCLDDTLPDYLRFISGIMWKLSEGERETLISLLGKVDSGISTSE